MAIRYKWQGNDAIIETISGNYLYKVTNPRDIYHEGGDIIVISDTMHRIRFTKEGIRKFE